MSLSKTFQAGPGRAGQGRAAHTEIFPLYWKDFARLLCSLARNNQLYLFSCLVKSAHELVGIGAPGIFFAQKNDENVSQFNRRLADLYI